MEKKILFFLIFLLLCGFFVLSFYDIGKEENVSLLNEKKETLKDENIKEKYEREKVDSHQKENDFRYTEDYFFVYDYSEEEKIIADSWSNLRYDVQKDKEGNIHIFSFSGKVLSFNDQGNLISSFATNFEQDGTEKRIAIDNDGNFYLSSLFMGGGVIQKHNKEGDFKGEIKIDEGVERVAEELLGMVVVDNKIYQLSKSASYFIGAIENGTIREADFSKKDGIIGRKTGDYYNIDVKRWRKLSIEIINHSRKKIQEIEIEMSDILSADFLKEDEKGNLYLLIEKTKGEFERVKEIYKIKREGFYFVFSKDEECGSIIGNKGESLLNVIEGEGQWRFVFCSIK